MALLFETFNDGNHYKVTQAGNSVRLYTNGIFHSQFNTNAIVTGALWDLLLLPAFLLPEPPKQVLTLGVGGGSVMRMVNHFFPEALIHGVDYDKQHLALAERYFGVQGSAFKLQWADAREYVQQRLAERNAVAPQIIIDDVFTGHNGDPTRPFAFDGQWLQQLLTLLSDNGLLIINFDRRVYLHQLLQDAKALCIQLGIIDAAEFYCPGYENRVLVLARVKLDKERFFQRLQAEPLLATRKRGCRLNFSMRLVW
ncbi:hypothetical protein [Halioxenophilus sp. WMMB6]|uniref:hypothetical protein n=1 Tax=Halioxenophilus sp. WMMB6 TaxID=3073815 RepID=UPI00295EF74D|nr:hypothetical protein [Halioxenophilus sp. WMMB6]